MADGVGVRQEKEKTASRETIWPSLLGNGLLERARSTTLALLGLTAAVGLGFIFLALNQDWPLIAGAPIPGASHQAVGKATVAAAGSEQIVLSQANQMSAQLDSSPSIRHTSPGAEAATPSGPPPAPAQVVAPAPGPPGSGTGDSPTDTNPAPAPDPAVEEPAVPPVATPSPAPTPPPAATATPAVPPETAAPNGPKLAGVDSDEHDHGEHGWDHGKSRDHGHAPISSPPPPPPIAAPDSRQSPEPDLPSWTHDSGHGHGFGHGGWHD